MFLFKQKEGVKGLKMEFWHLGLTPRAVIKSQYSKTQGNEGQLSDEIAHNVRGLLGRPRMWVQTFWGSVNFEIQNAVKTEMCCETLPVRKPHDGVNEFFRNLMVPVVQCLVWILPIFCTWINAGCEGWAGMRIVGSYTHRCVWVCLSKLCPIH